MHMGEFALDAAVRRLDLAPALLAVCSAELHDIGAAGLLLQLTGA